MELMNEQQEADLLEAQFKVNRARSEVNDAWNEEAILAMNLRAAQARVTKALTDFETAIREHERLQLP